MRVAAVDVGSNSIRLLVAVVTGKGEVLPVLRDLKTTRLGKGFTGGRLLDEPVEKTLAVITDFIRRAERAGAEDIVLSATSAVRDAGNRADFVRRVEAVSGKKLLVLSGAEEARLGYLGATRGLGGVDDGVVVDIGGGSTEFIWHRAGEVQCRSVNAGAVRMTEGGYGRGEIRALIQETVLSVRRDGYEEVVGVGGTVTTLAAMARQLRRYDPDQVHGYRLGRDAIDRMDTTLHAMSPAERQQLPGLQPERADIIPAGVRILSRVLHGLEADSVVVSEADILYGLALGARRMS